MSKAYSKTMKKRPKATASMQGAVINALGVVVSNLIKGASQDVEKIVRFAVWGARRMAETRAPRAPVLSL